MNNPNYFRVFKTFVSNSLIRDMTYRANFILDCVSSLSWVFMNLGFYILVFRYTPMIGKGTGWGQYEFFVFLSTTLFVNSLVQAFFMPNAEEFGNLIRTGSLDFVLLKPIDTQFLISLARIEWSSLGNFFFGLGLLIYSFMHLDYRPGILACLLYSAYVLCGVAILYSLMIALASAGMWLGRNQSLYDFWFYITNFSRYPMEIYQGRFGDPLRITFTFLIPILVVVNVPAKLMSKPLAAQNWPLALFALGATVGSLFLSRRFFYYSLRHYRSAGG